MAARALPSVQSLPHMVGRLQFIKDSPIFATEQPYEVIGALPPGQEALRNNTEFEFHELPVYDLRQEFGTPSLDVHGFEYLLRPELTSFDTDTEDGLKDYLRAVLVLFQERFQTKDVLVYNYNMRDSSQPTSPEEFSGSKENPQSVVTEAHTDGTLEGGPRRIRHQLGEDFYKYQDGSWRFRIVTLWRPFQAVEEAPLALCDASSLGRHDLIHVARPAADFVGEVAYVKFNPDQRWYWLSDQQPDELLLFSSYDSMDSTKIVPHAAVLGVGEEDLSRGSTRTRKSIDVRAIIMSKC